MILTRLLPLLALAALPGAAFASDISTHVLDLATGKGGQGIPVTLARQAADGGWQRIAAATTDADGRIRAFGPSSLTPPGTYRIHFDMRARTDGFFPEIAIVFRATDAAGHYHVPVVVSPFGYSTYRGN